jgi:hypothetical protein
MPIVAGGRFAKLLERELRLGSLFGTAVVVLCYILGALFDETYGRICFVRVYAEG